MKIESIIKRPQGLEVELGQDVYVFNQDNNYITEVTNEDHAAVFINIPEGYCEVFDGNEPDENEEQAELQEEQQDDERAQLVQFFIEKFGKRPHHKLSTDKIRQALEQ